MKQFCAAYNEDGPAVIPKLTRFSDEECVVTFPHDVPFDLFCFFVNYMYYPVGIFYKAEIKAWTTTQLADEWVVQKVIGKE